jgi:hypothetical protein
VARSAARPSTAGIVPSGAGSGRASRRCRHGGGASTKPGEPGEALHREPLDAGDQTGDEAKAQGWAPVVSTPRATASPTITWKPNQVVDPTKDKRIATGREI